MTPEEKKALRDSILARIKEIQASLASLEETAKPVEPDVAIGRLTRMDAMQQQKMQEENFKIAKSNILKLQDGLEKLEGDTFGQCHYCKQTIGFERLKALPESYMCIQCAEKYGY